MNPAKMAVAGSLESNDVLVRVKPAGKLTIDIQSPVFEQYGNEIRATVDRVLEELGIDSAEISLTDRGALDCTIEARLRTALDRACE